MAEGGGEEKQFIGKLLQKGTKYGTNSRLTQKSSVYIKHKITKGDTLQGISLKYGTTVEKIKRENKLWTNDSLFLREHLLIPVQHEDVSSIPEHYETITIDPVTRARSSSQKSNSSGNSAKSDDVNDKHVTNDASKFSKDSIKCEFSGMDFLSKYDSSIAMLKSNVHEMEKNARSLPCTLIDKSDTYPRRKSSNYSSSTFHGCRKGSMDSNGQVASFYDNDGFSGSEKDLTNSPVLMIKSKSSNRQVRSSLNRIQQQNDEIFEL